KRDYERALQRHLLSVGPRTAAREDGSSRLRAVFTARQRSIFARPGRRRLAASPGSTLVLVELDHVLIAVDDLAAAARELEARHGLASIRGGRHPGWGTANRIVPLGQTYLELV